MQTTYEIFVVEFDWNLFPVTEFYLPQHMLMCAVGTILRQVASLEMMRQCEKSVLTHQKQMSLAAVIE